MTVRRAVPDDARGIAEVQVGTWRVAYAGVVEYEVPRWRPSTCWPTAGARASALPELRYRLALSTI